MKPKFRSLKTRIGTTLSGVVVMSFAAAASAGAQTTWTGASSQDFSDAANWSAGVPAAANNGTINTVGATSPISTSTIDYGSNVDLFVGDGAASSGEFLQSAGTLTSTGWMFAGNNGGTGTINQDAGSVFNANSFRIGVGTGVSTGILNVNGTINTDSFNIGGGSGVTDTAVGTVNVNSGGIVNCEFDTLMAFAGDVSTQGTMNINGGTVNVASTNERWVILGQWDLGSSTLNVTNGGTLNLAAGTDIVSAQNNNSGDRVINVNNASILGTPPGTNDASFIKLGIGGAGTDEVNITNGGLVQMQSIYVQGGATSATVNFDGGTLKAIANDANIILLGNAATSAITTEGAGATIDTSGFAVGINEAISGAAGVTVSGGGSLFLGGANTYGGVTNVVDAGTRVGADCPLPGGVVLADNTGLDFTNGVSGNVMDLSSSGLTWGLSNTLKVEVGGGTADKVDFGGTGTYSAPIIPVDVDVAVVGSLGTGVRKLITGAVGMNLANYNLVTPNPTGYSFALQVTGNDLELVITSEAPPTAFWKGGTDGNWNTPDGAFFNWAQDDTGASSTVTGPGLATDVTFSATGAANEATTLGTDFVINSLNYDASAGNVSIGVIGAETLTVNFGIANNSVLAQTIAAPLILGFAQDIDTAADIILPGTVTASAAVTKIGAGTLALSGGFTGTAMTVNGGILASTGTYAGTALTVNGGILNSSGTLALTGDFLVGDGSTTGVVNVTAGTVSTDTIIGVGWGGNNTTLQSGTMNVTGGSVSSEGDLIVGFAGAATSSGTMTVETGGVVNVGTATERWLIMGNWDTVDSTLNVNAGGTINLNAGTDLRVGQGSAGTAVLNVDGGSIIGSLTDGVHDASLIAMDNSANSTINLQNGAVVQVKAIFGGAAGATLNIDNATVRAIEDDPGFINVWGAGSAANILAGGAILDSNGFNVTTLSPLSGTGGLTKNGSGTLALGAVNTYTGTTRVNEGVLAVNGDSLEDSTTLNIISASAAKVDLTGIEVVAVLQFDDAPQPTGVTYGATGSGADVIDDAHFTGTGVLSVGVVVDPDSDSDGITDTWEIDNFGDLDQDETTDFDGDGTLDIDEFRLGLDPTDGSSTFKASVSGADVSWQGVAGLSFTVQRSADLVNWTDLTTVVGVDGTNTYTDPAPLAGKGFYRVLLNP